MQKTSKRKSKKILADFFEARCRVTDFDIRADLRRINGGSRLKGVFAALLIYGMGFAIAWYAWSSGMVDDTMFYKSSWVVLLPATVVGLLVWMLTHNREENFMRQRLMAAIRNLEGEGGFLWRFAPLLSWARPDDYDTKSVVNLSREGKTDSVEPEEYAAAVLVVNEILQNMNVRPVAGDVLQEVEVNIAADSPAED